LNLIQEKIDKNDQAINLSLCRLYCYSKWKVLQYAYVFTPDLSEQEAWLHDYTLG